MIPSNPAKRAPGIGSCRLSPWRHLAYHSFCRFAPSAQSKTGPMRHGRSLPDVELVSSCLLFNQQSPKPCGGRALEALKSKIASRGDSTPPRLVATSLNQDPNPAPYPPVAAITVAPHRQRVLVFVYQCGFGGGKVPKNSQFRYPHIP